MKAILVLPVLPPEATPHWRKMRRIFGKSPAQLADLHRDLERRPWVALVTAVNGRTERSFLKPDTSYADAEDDGSGIERCYVLDSGPLYEVNEWIDWRTERRYFIRVTHGGAREILTRESAMEHLGLSDQSASTS